VKLKAIYDLAVELGKKYDIRKDYLDDLHKQQRHIFDNLPDNEKKLYDMESLNNPYSDTRILVGSGEEEVRTILCGIDMETPELILADCLNQKGYEIDLVMAHHPEGIAQAALYEVMSLQNDMLEKAGIPINIAEGIMTSRISEVMRGFMPLNHQRAVDAAALLNIPFMCVHTPADNMVNHFLNKLLDESEYLTVDDIMHLLLEIPEYKRAAELKAGPRIVAGKGKNRAGKIFIKMTGGTSGANEIFEKLANAGIGTFICMHMPEKQRELAKQNHINVIIAGHMASDSLGLNLYLDELEKRGIRVIPCSGLIRVNRGKASK